MLCKVYCACCNGLEVTTITVEVSVTDGISQCNEGDWVARDQDGGCHVLKAEEMQ